MNECYENGWIMLMEVDGEGGKWVIELLKDIVFDIGKYVIEFVFGDIYIREGFNL